MARMRKHPGGHGPVRRLPWQDDAWPSDWSRSTRLGRRQRSGTGRSPRPGARTGPVRNGRR